MIPFTQFLRPNGKRREGGFERPPNIEMKARALIKSRCRFECKMLINGDIHMDVTRDEDGESVVIANALAANDSRIFGVVDELVETAYQRVLGDGGV